MTVVKVYWQGFGNDWSFKYFRTAQAAAAYMDNMEDMYPTQKMTELVDIASIRHMDLTDVEYEDDFMEVVRTS